MNRDTREIMRVFESIDKAQHSLALRKPLNAAAMLCEDYCVSPAGFVLEDEISFELHEAQHPYLEDGLLKFPIRELSLADFAEKKRGEYALARNRYSGLYDDSRMNFLSSFGSAIVPRRVQIGPAIVAGFQAGVDTKLPAWRRIRERAPPSLIENMRHAPGRLSAEGKALTWSIMQPHFGQGSDEFAQDMRNALQFTYFVEYCREFKLIALDEIPYLNLTFFLPIDRSIYSYRKFQAFLSQIGISDLFLDASADFIIKMRKTPGFQELMDAYVGMAGRHSSQTDLCYHTGLALRAIRFDWRRIIARHSGMLNDPTDLECLEIADGCTELASVLTSQHGLATRSAQAPILKPRATIVQTKVTQVKLAIFVALEEELNILLKHLSLSRRPEQPVAIGKCGEIDIEVICPRAMGRVPAAIEVTKYLGRVNPKPDIILCVGLAGGFKEAKIDPGTVICAETVVDLGNRKVFDSADATQTKFRRQDHDCARAIYSVMKSDEFDIGGWENHCRQEFDWPDGRVPSLREGKIASVDEVIASDEHRAKLIDAVDKLLGVEMEAGGVCAAAKLYKIPYEVLRVVSDMADPSKADDKWRSVGMKTLAELIKRLPLARVVEVTKS